MMRVMFAAAVLTALWPARVQAQTAEIQRAVNQQLREARASAQQESMYENIEIMRRILNRALTHAYRPQFGIHTPQATVGSDGQFFTNYLVEGINDPNRLGGQYSANINTSTGVATLYDAVEASNLAAKYVDYDRAYQAANWAANQQPRWQAPLAAVEGVYLKGQGVVYTVTLPPHERVALDPHSGQVFNQAYCTTCHVDAFQLTGGKSAAPRADKLPSLWEQTRREVKGLPGETPKKPTADAKKLEVCGPGTVGEAVLRTLAENGRHLTVTGKESVAVAITFRPTASGTTPPPRYLRSTSANQSPVRGDVFDPAAGQVGQRNQPSADNKNPLAGGSEEGKAKDDTKARWTEELWLKQGYENLADLHMKQKRYAEAVEAYQKALDQSKDLKQQDAIRAKLLDALKAQLNVIDSVLAQSRETQDLRKKLLDSAQAYLKGVEGDLVKQLEAKPKSSPLASKLIIVAPKELLDQVGQGKMSFDDFRKAATVEYLTFGGSK